MTGNPGWLDGVCLIAGYMVATALIAWVRDVIR